MNRFISSIALCFVWVCALLSAPSQAQIIAANIEVSLISNNGAFTITWDAHSNNPEEGCVYFEITVLQTGSSSVFDYYETLNCNQKSFSVTNYPVGEYEIEISTAYESFTNGNYHFDTASILPFSVSVVAGGATAYDLSENFESGWGSWSNTGSYNWYINSGSTPSGSTGPSSAAQGDSYAYFETTSGYAFNTGNTAILQSANLSSSDDIITFQYHMFGANTGTLYLELFNGSQWIVIWSKNGQQHSSSTTPWSEVSVPISHASSNAKLRFRAVAVGGYRGDIGIDNIRLEPSSVTYEYEPTGHLIKIK
ncbi:hypothetical protein [Catenovulum sediminis]|uniref:hypothetical protein n=1 Tax=Catenovulum sediminis TaxID=1740262 RepID=UPI00117C66F4|nr:hypothetical protein [Catenovulum sediminis]